MKHFSLLPLFPTQPRVSTLHFSSRGSSRGSHFALLGGARPCALTVPAWSGARRQSRALRLSRALGSTAGSGWTVRGRTREGGCLPGMSFGKLWFSFAGEFLSRSRAPSDTWVWTRCAQVRARSRSHDLELGFPPQRGRVLRAGPRPHFSLRSPSFQRGAWLM